MILAGDVGGTKVHLALYDFAGGRLHPIRDQKFPAHQFSSLDDVVNKFLSGDADTPQTHRADILASCFGVPGPVRDGRLKLTNLPWTLDCREISKALGIQHVFLINDLEANGYGIPELADDKIFTLHAGDDPAIGHRGLIAAGTGLGQALLIWDGKQHRPIASEGGHCDFAARSNREIALLDYLPHYSQRPRQLGARRLRSWHQERLRVPARRRRYQRTSWLRDRMKAEDPNAVIGQCAEDGSSSLCFETMKTFVSAYGAETGNIALKVLATGGMYLGGGIAPKILKTLQNGFFTQAFLDKGRLSPLLQSIPVRVILDDTCALLGAAAYAEARAVELGARSERAASIQAV